MHAPYDADFRFTFDFLVAFFRQTRIRGALATLDASGTTGWERWWQCELLLHAHNHEDIKDPHTEVWFFTDQRRKPRNGTAAVDFAFRRRGHSRNHLIFLELSQHSDWQECIAKMLRDARKLDGLQSRSQNRWSIRNFLVAGVHSRISKTIVRKYVADKSEEFGISADVVRSQVISGTPFALTVF
jgi:hypothetical protein